MKLASDRFPHLVLTGQVVDNEAGKSSAADPAADPTGENRELRRGDLCPQCKQVRLDYDGLLNLSCAHCGFALGGCFT